ncbi:MAG: hypothetical protein V7603_1155 [Micromonosporaceae bacterium]
MGRYPKIPAPALNRISPPLAGVLNVVSARWGPLVIMALSDGHIRFNVLHRHLEGVSHKVLIETLRMLQREGIVCRVAIAEPVQNVDVAEYRLTDLGRDLLGWIEAIRRWAEMRSAVRNEVGASSSGRDRRPFENTGGLEHPPSGPLLGRCGRDCRKNVDGEPTRWQQYPTVSTKRGTPRTPSTAR